MQPPSESLIEYPCHFPIKVLGIEQAGFADAIVDLVCQFDPGFDRAGVVLRPSAKGNYIGATVAPCIKNREQLDALYQALTSHPLVKFVL